VKKKTTEEQLALAGTEEGQILARLSERVEKAIQMIQELRKERDQLKSRLQEAETKARGFDPAIQEEYERFKRERGVIKDRIETILSSLESLDASE
jgi:FtsZ-binding cell division protein ZapB